MNVRNGHYQQEIDIIKSYAVLKKLWHFGIEAIDDDVINRAIILVGELNQYGFNVRSFPEADGTISLSFFVHEHFFDIEVSNADWYEASYEKCMGDEFESVFCKNMTVDEIKALLQEIQQPT